MLPTPSIAAYCGEEAACDCFGSSTFQASNETKRTESWIQAAEQSVLCRVARF